MLQERMPGLGKPGVMMNRTRESIERFRRALGSRGIIAPAEIIADGHIHRCDAEGKNGKSDPAAEARLQRVIAMLDARPGMRYAVLTNTEADPEVVIITLAIRGKAACELHIPRDKYDGVLLLDLIDRHGVTVH